MVKRTFLLVAAGAAVLLSACASFQASETERASAARANPAAAQQQLVDRAVNTIAEARTDAAFGNAPDLLRRARAVLIVPSLVKGGFIVGGEGGRGVMLARNDGSWSYPAFYTLASGSLGLQAGVQTAELVMFLMSDEAYQALLDDQLKFGGQASLAVATIGSGVQGATTPQLDADIVIWSKAQGAFAGLTLEGSAVTPWTESNTAFYGQPLDPAVILSGGARNPGADRLRQALNGDLTS
jgi:lipid-binding SYLF domain-containing protein